MGIFAPVLLTACFQPLNKNTFMRTHRTPGSIPGSIVVALACASALAQQPVITSRQGNDQSQVAHIYVDPVRGDDNQDATEAHPRKTLSAALSLLPQEIRSNVTVHLKPGLYSTTGGQGMPENQLILTRNTSPGIVIALKGEAVNRWPEQVAILDWHSGYDFMVTVLNGHWSFSDIQLGTRHKSQRQGFCSEGSASLLDLRDIHIRNGSHTGSGIKAQRAGRVHLYGKIELNEDLHDACPDSETFCRVHAADHGTVRFMDHSPGTLLSIGHGGLTSEYYGCIGLGCERAKITTWKPGERNLGIGNSGRIDLHGTKIHLRGQAGTSYLIGLEDDGHILAEGTHVILESLGCHGAIGLLKASKVFGGPFEVRGAFINTVVAMSGSVFAGIVTGAVSHVESLTGACIVLQHRSSMPRTARGRLGGTVVLADDRVLREANWP